MRMGHPPFQCKKEGLLAFFLKIASQIPLLHKSKVNPLTSRVEFWTWPGGGSAPIFCLNVTSSNKERKAIFLLPACSDVSICHPSAQPLRLEGLCGAHWPPALHVQPQGCGNKEADAFSLRTFWAPLTMEERGCCVCMCWCGLSGSVAVHGPWGGQHSDGLLQHSGSSRKGFASDSSAGGSVLYWGCCCLGLLKRQKPT